MLKAQQQEAIRQRDELKTALAKAERDLSFTEIRAPVDRRGRQPRHAGRRLCAESGSGSRALCRSIEVYVVANFKETQVGRLQPGQKVLVSVDALPEHQIEGTVESFSPASGAIFSLLPPDNATGNFTKIVQRLPVRIHVPEDVAVQRALRPGMSVVVRVDTRAGARPRRAPYVQPLKTAAVK